MIFTFSISCVLFCQDASLPIVFACVGDIMLGSDYRDDRLPPNEGRQLFEQAREFLSAADVAIGNLEGVITTSGNCTKNISNGHAYAFRMPPYLAPRLVEAGFDVLNIANNHSNDFGSDGIFDTETMLDSLEIAHTGRYGDIAIIEIRESKIAVIGFSSNSLHHSIFDATTAMALVESLDICCDIVVCTFHGGAEGAKHIHLPHGTEYFYNEARGDLRAFSHCLIDAGADLVFGHGPHVPRAIELYGGKIIAYSLGNFCTWYGISVSGINGLAPLLWLELDCDGNFQNMKIVSFEQHSNHCPILDPENRAAHLILQLSESDVKEFPYELLYSIKETE